jgi:hypothetical protein
MADEKRDIEHAAAIERLKAQAAAAGGRMVVHEAEGLSLDAREEFWGRVVAFETARTTNLLKELTAAGVALPEPDENSRTQYH